MNPYLVAMFRDDIRVRCAALANKHTPNELLDLGVKTKDSDLCYFALFACNANAIEKMLYDATNMGNRELCVMAYERHLGYHGSRQTLLNNMLAHAARAGHPDLCALAREWCMQRPGSEFRTGNEPFQPDLRRMLSSATIAANREICELAHKWIMQDTSRETLTRYVDFGAMISCATRRSNCELRELAYEWLQSLPIRGKTSPEQYMLEGAALGGHRELCELAREWHTNAPQLDFDSMLDKAASGDHRELCDLACEWARASGHSVHYQSMLKGAARGNHPELCEIARAKNTDDISCAFILLITAARANHPELCELARKWDDALPVSDIEDVLEEIVIYGHYNVCKFLLGWLADRSCITSRILRIVLYIATRHDYPEICKLAHDQSLLLQFKLDHTEMRDIARMNGSYRCELLAYEWM
jgi:hypothetical protein